MHGVEGRRGLFAADNNAVERQMMLAGGLRRAILTAKSKDECFEHFFS